MTPILFKKTLTPFSLILTFSLLTSNMLAAGDFQSAAEVSVPGSPVKLKLWETWEQERTRFWYAISQDGLNFGEPIAADYRIKLKYKTFDPSQEAAPLPDEPWLRAGSDTHLYLVQFHTQSLEAYRQVIRHLGGEIYKFLPSYSHIVLLSDRARQQLENQDFVRWLGPFQPAWRLEQYLLDNLDRAQQVFPLARYNIMVMKPQHKEIIAHRIELLGGLIFRADAGKNLLEADLTPDQLIELSRADEVMYIDRWSEGGSDMDIAREIGGADYIENLEGWDGTGLRVEIIDLGFNMTHVDFNHHPLIPHTQVDENFHGASCSGIMVGNGLGDPTARGMLPNAQGLVADWDQVSIGPSRYTLTGELLEDPWLAVIQSSSVGSAQTLEYSTISADTDQALFDFDLLFCQSQSNLGSRFSRPQAWAKNILSGGGIDHQNTLTRDDDCWCHGASIGPASDGRIKPDLVHFYEGIFTVTTGSNTAYTPNFGGTSGATPIICGHVGLIIQMWSEGIFGNPITPGATPFENRPHMTTAKALAINTASPYDFNGIDHDLTRVHQGWGLPDLKSLYDYRDNIFVVNEERLLNNLETASYILQVQPGEPILRVTLTYSDPPGSPASAVARINDLNLHVVSPSGTDYWGNNGLLTANVSTPDGVPNQVDTVENVFLPNPEAGDWTVEVIAAEVNEDGHVETPAVDADFALVVTGATQRPDFSLESLHQTLEACNTGPVQFEISLSASNGFALPITLSVTGNPPGSLINFSTNPVTPPGTTTLSIGDTANVDPGFYTIEVLGEADQLTKSLLLSLYLNTPITGNLNLVSPTDFSSEVPLNPTLSWSAVDQALHYQLQLASEPAFISPILDQTLEETSLSLASPLEFLSTYYWRVRAINGCGAGSWSAVYAFLTQDQFDFMTELFSEGDNDLDNRTTAFVLNGLSDYYQVCGWQADGLPTDPAGGTSLNLGNDDFVELPLSPPIVLYGVHYSSIYVGSNGRVTFNSGSNINTESLTAHFNRPGVSALFDDLDPTSGGSVSYKQEADHLAITWEDVPKFASSLLNTFQVQFFHNGEIHLTWERIDSTDGLVGLSDGQGIPPDFIETDMTAQDGCQQSCEGDFNRDGAVNFFDLLMLINHWNRNNGLTDLDGDGLNSILDLSLLVNLYGDCP